MPAKSEGHAELRAVLRENRYLLWFVGAFSVFVNLLMLTGPLYMLQIYDRVLGSGSVETLVALSLLVVFLYGMMGILDYSRGRVMGRVAGRFQSRLNKRVYDASMDKSARKSDENAATGLRDLETVQKLLASPVFTSAFDIPWTPIFLAAIWIFHPWLGVLALSGGALLIMVTVLNQVTTRKPVTEANRAAFQADSMAGQIRNDAEMVQALGMRDALFSRWQNLREQALNQQISSSDLTGTFGTTTKTLRLMLQSAMLGVGALLVLRVELTPGAMIAGSILLGRALAPIEQTINQWPFVQSAMKGWQSLAKLLDDVPTEPPKTELPQPRAHLELQQVTVFPPGSREAVLRQVSFDVEPGQAIGVIGASGAGKSSLARVITNVWAPDGGYVRLDGATLDQYAPDALGRHIGYLPQRVQLFDGTIAENIARMIPQPDSDKVIEAAKKADAHEMIVELPDGYDTRVSGNGGRLSGGQMQRIGLARAMYGDPVILVLDEPNSNLDNEGSEAVNTAIRGFKEAGKSLLIMAHRPAAIKECDKLLMLSEGRVRAFGPKDEVLKEVVRNQAHIVQSVGNGGVQ